MSDETKILVSEISKLYGLSNQTLHYYEEKSIIHPTRDILNNYRYFRQDDVKILGALKKYRNADFTLDEAYQMSMTDSHDEIIRKIKSKKDYTLKLLKEKQLIIDSLDEKINLSQRYDEIGNKPLLEKKSEQYIFAAYDKEVTAQEDIFKKEASLWFKNIFFTYACGVYEQVNCEDKFKKVAYGMTASKDVVEYLNLEKTENVIEIEEGDVVTATAITKSNQDILDEMEKVKKFIFEKNYKMRNSPFVKTIFSSKGNDDDYELFVYINFPIF